MNINELKQLYKEGFDDSDGYVDFFFKSIAKSGNVLNISVDGKIVSAGYIVEKPAHIFGKTTTVPYLSALSTSKEYRGRGYIGQVISDAFTRLYNDGHIVTLLYPFNPDYYKRYGFTDVSFCRTRTVEGGQKYGMRRITRADFDAVKNIYAQMMSGFDNSLILNGEMLKLKIEEYSADNIEGFILSDNGSDFAFGFIEDGEIPFYAAADMNSFHKADEIKGLTYKDFFGENEPYVQARILNARKLLEVYPYSSKLNLNIKIGIIDPYFKDNNINCNLQIQNGRAVLSDCGSADTVFSIDELAKKVFCGDALLFKSAKNCFIDKY